MMIYWIQRNKRCKKFIQPVNYWRTLQTNKNQSAFDDNYTEYEIKGDKNKNLSHEEYLNIIKPYLSDMINNHKTQSEWKI